MIKVSKKIKSKMEYKKKDVCINQNDTAKVNHMNEGTFFGKKH